MTDAALHRPMTEDDARRRAFYLAWAAGAAFATVQNTVNALSVAHELPNLRPAEPFVWEYTSGVLAVALIPGVAWLLRLAPPRREAWLKFVLVHLAGSVAFTAIHVGGFVVLRKAIYAAAGAHYGSPEWIYEYRKDFTTYLAFLLVLWIVDWAATLWARSRVPDPPAGPRLYHLRDGSRTVRVPLDEIVAVTSARNYVEFHLADGARPLVRDTLAKVEADLAAAGFLRTHRSWLVNPAHVRAVTPAAAGDFRLELASGLVAPLSRRFPGALESLRTPSA